MTLYSLNQISSFCLLATFS